MSAWWQEALRYPAQHRAALAWIVVLSLVSIGLNLLLPWPVKLIVDGVLAGKPLPRGSGCAGAGAPPSSFCGSRSHRPVCSCCSA